MTEITKEKMEKHLVENGWFQWYSNNYWCHKTKTTNKEWQDPTNYGLTLEKAYEFDTGGSEPFNGQFLGHLGGLRW